MSGFTHLQLSGIRVSTRRVALLVGAAGEIISFDVFFDYQCPFVYRAAEMIEAVRRSGERNLDVRWRYFSLTQVNSKNDGWTVWGAPASEPVRGRLAFQAAEAARRQGRFDGMHWGLLRARHRDRLDLDDPGVVEAVAREAGLDLERFRRDANDRSTLEVLASDHTAAVTEHGVFGTPTFVFPSGDAAYVRLAASALNGGAVEVLDRVFGVAAAEPRILEIKRPQKPA
jgi:predicted DsbA family dithiol-disulfide isomerase